MRKVFINCDDNGIEKCYPVMTKEMFETTLQIFPDAFSDFVLELYAPMTFKFSLDLLDDREFYFIDGKTICIIFEENFDCIELC